jgi:hypothetical protein
MTVVASIACIFIVFDWGDAAYWLRSEYQDFPSRIRAQENNVESYILQGKVYPDTNWSQSYLSQNPGFFQLVPTKIGDQLRGKTVTIGAWVWSDRNITGYSPGLNSLLQVQDRWFGLQQESLNQKPHFIASVVQLPEQQDRLQIWLRTTSIENQDARIYFSGIILVEGAWPVDMPPSFIDKDGSKGIWGDQPFTNLVRNAQFQHTWPYLEPKIFKIVTSKIQDLNAVHVSSFLSLFLDIPGTKWYTESTGNVIFHTFWAKFCWGQVPLISNSHWLYPYRILLAITLLGVIGALLFSFKYVKMSKNEFGFLAIIIVLTVIVALLYGVYTMGGALRFRAFIPTARYIYPAIIPISLFLVIGWRELSTWVVNALKISTRVVTTLYLGLFITLDLYSIASVLIYFNKP